MDAGAFEPAPDRRSRRPRNVALMLGSVAAVAAFVGFSLLTRSGQKEKPRLVSNVWIASAGDQPRLYYVMEEERWERRVPSWTRRMYWFTVDYSLFTLQARDAHTGDPGGATQLARIDNCPSGQGPDILGPLGRVLWVWNAGLEARDLDTLEPVWTPARLRELNGELAGLMPEERKYFKVVSPLQALVFKGRDARYYQVDSATGKILVVPDETLGGLFHTKRADDGFYYAVTDSAGLWSTSVSGLMWDSFATPEAWYGLVTSDELAKMPDRPGDGRAPTGDVARTLVRAGYTKEYSQIFQKDQLRLQKDTVTPVGDQRFLMGGFLRRPGTAQLWGVDGHRAILVLHRDVLGADGRWRITCLGLDGAARWTSALGLCDLQYLCDAHGLVVLTGYTDARQPTSERPHRMVFVEEASGKVRTLDLASGQWQDGTVKPG